MGAPLPPDKLWIEAQHTDPVLMEELARVYAGSPYGQRCGLAAGLHRELGAFISRWRLPGRAWQDLADSYEWHVRHGAETRRLPELRLGGFGEFQPVPGLPVVADVQQVDGTRVAIVEHEPWILPNHPLPFRYDPLSHDRRWLEEQVDALCRELRESVLAQARLYEEEVEVYGWVRLPPRWTADTVRKGIERLYLRVVRGLSWGEVAYQTGCDKAQAKRQVRLFAGLLDVTLPQDPR
jgi:hypothetical protein